MSVILKRTVSDDIDWRFDSLSGIHLQSHLTDAIEKAEPETGTAQVSFNLNLEKPVATVAFQEKIEDVVHLLDDEQSILASPTNTY